MTQSRSLLLRDAALAATMDADAVVEDDVPRDMRRVIDSD